MARERHRRRRRRRRPRRGVVAAVAALAAVTVAIAILRGGVADTPPPAAASHAPASAAATRPDATETSGGGARSAASQPLAMPARRARASVRVPVLMFHRVAGADTITNAVSADLTVTPERFAAEMESLHREGYHPISEAALFRGLFEGERLPQRPVVLTFDDGYVDAVVSVAPVLRRYGWPATFAVITARAGQAAFLTWPQIVELDREGMDIASHSRDHVELAGAGTEVLAAQLAGSRRALQAHLGHPVGWLVWPAGSHDADAEASARAAGYLLAYTTEPGSTISSATPMAEPRVRVHGAETLPEFAASLAAASGG